ncbi:hypothetical protein [Nocardiopsis metallicus]
MLAEAGSAPERPRAHEDLAEAAFNSAYQCGRPTTPSTIGGHSTWTGN